MNLLKKIYHVFLKRDVKSWLFTRKFKKFGSNSILYKPLKVSSHSDIVIGDNTTILNGARMQVYNSITGLKSNIIIGNHCYIGYNNTFLAGENIVIEDGVLMASNILLSSENHSINPESSKYYMRDKKKSNDNRKQQSHVRIGRSNRNYWRTLQPTRSIQRIYRGNGRGRLRQQNSRPSQQWQGDSGIP